MNSRDRLLKTLTHQEPDKIPYDLGSSQLTGISAVAYANLRKHLNFPDEDIVMSDVVQQLALPSEDILEYLQVDTRGLFPLTSHNDNIGSKLEDAGHAWQFTDEWGIIQQMPKENGHWYSIAETPLGNKEPELQVLENHPWPVAAQKRRIHGLKRMAQQYKDAGKAVVIKGLCAGIFEMTQRIRGMENAMMDPMLYPQFSDMLIGKLTDLKIEFWKMALTELGDLVDVIVEADDYGTQVSQLISPEQFRSTFKPHIQRLVKAIKQKAPNVAVFFHSCGNVRPIISDFIEIGIDILNPVHIKATGMDPVSLKKDFGSDITFWGGGVETQDILPNGTPQQVADDVKRNIDALAPGGGFVFNTVHNIQAEVPVENIMAMWKTLQEYGKY